MPNLEFRLPVAIGGEVLVSTDGLLGQVAMVTAWRVVRPRFLLGGVLDRPLQLTLEEHLKDGRELWLDASEVTGSGAAVSFFLPFMGGDQVRVLPSGARGEVVGWEVTGRQLAAEVIYRVHLAGTLPGDEIEVDAHNLVSQLLG